MDLAIVAALSFIVNIVVEVTKGLPLVNKVPTKAWAIIVSVFVNFLVLGIKGTVLTVAVVCEVILCALIVAYIAIFGFDTFKELYDRFMEGREEE